MLEIVIITWCVYLQLRMKNTLTSPCPELHKLQVRTEAFSLSAYLIVLSVGNLCKMIHKNETNINRIFTHVITHIPFVLFYAIFISFLTSDKISQNILVCKNYIDALRVDLTMTKYLDVFYIFVYLYICI